MEGLLLGNGWWIGGLMVGRLVVGGLMVGRLVVNGR